MLFTLLITHFVIGIDSDVHFLDSIFLNKFNYLVLVYSSKMEIGNLALSGQVLLSNLVK